MSLSQVLVGYVVVGWFPLATSAMDASAESVAGAQSASQALVKSSAVMKRFGYASRAAFWEFVRRDGVPHIRFNARRIMFEERALEDWLSRRSTWRLR